MTANEVIEAYVQDVAKQLPRAQREDVARELNALLQDELRGKAEAGELVDASAATAWVNAFGHPTQVAARYRPVLHVIDPADGARFVRLSVLGLLVIWGLGLLAQIERAQGTDAHWLNALQMWWVSSLLPSFWWPGVLVLWFSIAAWTRQRWPARSAWMPRDPDRLPGGRAGTVLAVLGIVAGLAVLVDPRGLLHALWGPTLSPQVLEAFTYAEPFRRREGLVLWVLLALNVPLLLAVTVQGRWSRRLRRSSLALSLATIALMVWLLFGGPVFLGPHTDQAMKLALLVSVGIGLIDLVQKHRSVQATRP